MLSSGVNLGFRLLELIIIIITFFFFFFLHKNMYYKDLSGCEG